MAVRWTGAASKFLTGPGADSHPDPGLLIARAREVAGDLANQLKLGNIWHGYRRVRLTDRVEVLATVINNFPGAEPVVMLQLIVDDKPLEEGDEEPPIGIVVAWPTWDIPPPTEGAYSEWPALMTPNIFGLGQGTADVVFKTRAFQSLDREIFTGATGTYKRFYQNGLQVGNVDWQGRGEEYALTWLVSEAAMAGAGNLGALRAQSQPAADAVLYRGEVLFALFDARYGVLGAAIETRPGATGDEDFLNIVLRYDPQDGSGDIALLMITRPFAAPFDEPVTVTDSVLIPPESDLTQPFFFNDSGTTAVGMFKRFNQVTEAKSNDHWRKPFEGLDGNVTRALFGETTMQSTGGIVTDMKETDNYAISHDPLNAGSTVLEKSPFLGQEPDWPSGVTSALTFPIAVDWQGDTLVRCKATLFELAATESFVWQESAGGALPRTDSGSFSGAFKDVLIEFEGSTLESFYLFEQLSNVGDYSVSFDVNGDVTSASSSHVSQSIHRRIFFLDMRYDFAAIAEADVNTTLTKVSVDDVAPTRTYDLSWTFKKGTDVLFTAADPQFSQDLWKGRFTLTTSLRPVDTGYRPDMWSATLAYFSANPLLEVLVAFRSGFDYIHDDETTFSHGGILLEQYSNFLSAPPLGLPYVDRRLHVASYKGEVGVYLFNTGRRLLDQMDQSPSELPNAVHTGHLLDKSGIFPTAQTGLLNSELGVSDGLSFQYELEPSNEGDVYVPQRIPNITLV